MAELKELYEQASQEQHFTHVSPEEFMAKAETLRNEGFIDFEIREFAQVDITSVAIKAMRNQRMAEFEDFTRDYIMRFSDKEISITEIIDTFQQEIEATYIDNGWVFKTKRGLDPWAYLHTFYDPKNPDTRTPTKKDRRRKTKNYASVRGRE